MAGMFDFFMDVGNYDARKVDRYEADGFFVDTCACSHGSKPFETAVEHPDYNDGEMVIVEAYDTKEEAQAGHAKWVKRMTADVLPEQLVDCQNAGLAGLLGATGDEMIYPRIQRQKKGVEK